MSTENEFSGFSWQNSKWMIKGLIIGVIALLLMIPLSYIRELVQEREKRAKEVSAEVSGKWAGPQNLIGPIAVIEYNEPDTARKTTVSRKAYVLPEKLDIQAEVSPREKHRSIFRVMLYDAKIRMTGYFRENLLKDLGISPEKINWERSHMLLSIADQKGLNKPIQLTLDSTRIEMEQEASGTGDHFTAPLKSEKNGTGTKLSFSVDVDLKGSHQLFFTPIGKTTTVSMKSSWQNPSFSGASLPQNSEIGKGGFTANWVSFAHTQSFPRQWTGEVFKLQHRFPRDAADYESRSEISSQAFGVDLYIPVNGYQNTLRSIKYALLCILLTFAAFFIIELTSKSSVHPFQYGLVGLALILFYSLLLSISEYTGFNWAYLIASVATIVLIGWFVKQILRSGRSTTILSFVLVVVYSYVFSLLNLEDYSLLFGSVGLFVMLGVLMYFSKKLKWQ
jgi:inner membrane protein